MPSPPGISCRAHSSASSCSVCAPDQRRDTAGSRGRARRRHGSPLNRHGPTEIGTAGSTTTSFSSVSRTRRCTTATTGRELAQHHLERVVDAGLERARLVDVESGSGRPARRLRCAAASAGRWAAGSRPAALDDDLDAGVGLGDEEPRRSVRRCWAAARNAMSGSWRSTSGCGFGCGSITTSATSPTRSAAEPGRTAAKLQHRVQVVEQRLVVGGFVAAGDEPEPGQEGCPRPLLGGLGQRLVAPSSLSRVRGSLIGGSHRPQLRARRPGRGRSRSSGRRRRSRRTGRGLGDGQAERSPTS